MIKTIMRNTFGFILVASLGLWFLIHSSYIQTPLIQKISEELSDAFGSPVTIESFSFALPVKVIANNIVVGEPGSPWLTAKHLKTSFSLLSIWESDFAPKSIEITEANLFNIPLSFNGEVLKEHIRLQSSIAGNILDIKSYFEWNDASVNIKEVEIEYTQMHLKGNLDVLLADNTIEGNISGSYHLLPQNRTTHADDVLNDVAIAVSFHREPYQTAQLEIHAPDVIFNEILVQGTRFTFFAKEFLTSPRADFHLTIDALHHRDHQVKNIALSSAIDNTKSEWPFSFSSEGDFFDHFTINAAGEWFFNGADFKIALRTLEGDIAHSPYSLMAATILKIAPDNLTLMPTAISMSTGVLHSSMTYAHDVLDAAILFDEIPLAFFSSLLPIRGILNGEIIVSGPLHHPHTSIALNTHSIALTENSFSSLPDSHTAIQAHIDDHGLSCQGNFEIVNYLPLQFDLMLPVTYSLRPFLINVDKEAPISCHLNGASELNSLLRIHPDPPALSGEIQASLDITGSLNAPHFSGVCDIANGTFEILKLGTSVHSVTAHIEATNSQLIFKEIAGVYDQGKVTGSGVMQIDSSNDFPFKLNFSLADIKLLNQDYAQGVFKGQLLLSGDTKAGHLTGALEAVNVTITIPEQAPALSNTIDVTYINLPPDEPAPQAYLLIPPPSDWPLHLDVAVNVPNTLHINGTDLTSEWKGDFKIQGTTQPPLLAGDLKVSKGQYNFNGKPFSINQGTITFAGEIDRRTNLYVIASKDLDEVDVDVILKGPIKHPSISFRSNPPLPQREILSWILFNRGSSEISPFQGSQLSESITNLDSKPHGPDIITQVRSALGIDRLDISRNAAGEENQVSVKVGKYITDDVLIYVNKSDVNSLAIEAALTDKVKLQAEVGDDSQGQLRLKWKRDY